MEFTSQRQLTSGSLKRLLMVLSQILLFHYILPVCQRIFDYYRSLHISEIGDIIDYKVMYKLGVR